jgi:uncharacterized membrane protein YeaQ/YmgE (transglycosylase-associated protein family)
VIGSLVFALVVGFIARMLAPGRQKLTIGMTLILGICGSIVGGVVAAALGTGDVWELNAVGSIVAIVASVFLVTAGSRFFAKR